MGLIQPMAHQLCWLAIQPTQPIETGPMVLSYKPIIYIYIYFFFSESELYNYIYKPFMMLFFFSRLFNFYVYCYCLSLHSFPPFESELKVWYSFGFVIIYVHLISNYFSVDFLTFFLNFSYMFLCEN